MTVEELQEKQALVKKLKSELKNEEMALVLLKKLKQSQTAAAREVGQVVQGGATLTPATAKTANSKSDPKGQYSSASKHNYDLLAADKLVSIRTCTCPTHVLLSASKWVESTPDAGESYQLSCRWKMPKVTGRHNFILAMSFSFSAYL